MRYTLASNEQKLVEFEELLILIAGLGIYRLSFKVQAHYFSEAGRQALSTGQLDIAYKKLAQAIAKNPFNANFHNNLGLVCKYQHWYCAEQQYQKALLNPMAQFIIIWLIYMNILAIVKEL